MTKTYKNFYLAEHLLGQNIVIKVEGQGFKYNHDNLLKYIYPLKFAKGCSAEKSWIKYKFYTKTKGFPSWAENYITHM